MIQDTLLLVSDGQTVTGGTTTVSTSSVDVSTVDRALGTGKPLYMNVVVTGLSGGDASDVVRFDLVHSANADLSSDAIVASSRTISNGTSGIAAGDKFSIPVPPSYVITGRYIGAAFDAITATLVLTVDVWFDHTPVNDITAYNDGI